MPPSLVGIHVVSPHQQIRSKSPCGTHPTLAGLPTVHLDKGISQGLPVVGLHTVHSRQRVCCKLTESRLKPPNLVGLHTVHRDKDIFLDFLVVGLHTVHPQQRVCCKLVPLLTLSAYTQYIATRAFYWTPSLSAYTQYLRDSEFVPLRYLPMPAYTQYLHGNDRQSIPLFLSETSRWRPTHSIYTATIVSRFR